MTVVSGKRRGRGEDSIYWDEAKNRYVGVVGLGYSVSGTRVRKKVMARTKTELGTSSRSCTLRARPPARNGWVPREMRHTFVSLLLARGVPAEAIALLAGHTQTATTELMYRHQIVPALTRGAEVKPAF